jgi:hypothetical protein
VTVPPVEESDLDFDAVLWPLEGTDRYGEPLHGAPVQLAVRWRTRRTEMRDPQGNVVAVDVTAAVDRVIAPGGQMALGTLADWAPVETGTGTAAVGEVLEVVAFSETWDVRAVDVRRTVGLARFRDALPTGA